jgi:clan AA aspartic protease
MISGQVNAKLEAVISLQIQGQKNLTLTIEALIDTGYTGYLTLPSALIEELGLENFATGQLTLADGTKVNSDLFVATIDWDGQPRSIEVDSLESEVLIGMSLLEGYDLQVRIAVDGEATITSFR